MSKPLPLQTERDEYREGRLSGSLIAAQQALETANLDAIHMEGGVSGPINKIVEAALDEVRAARERISRL